MTDECNVCFGPCTWMVQCDDGTFAYTLDDTANVLRCQWCGCIKQVRNVPDREVQSLKFEGVNI